MAEMMISVPDGYTVKEDCCEMPMDQAVVLLCSEQQKNYACAVRKENGTVARLIQLWYVCPYCGEVFSDLSSFQAKNGEKKQLPAEKIHEWAYPLREGLFAPKIEFTAFDRQEEAVFCPHCGRICKPYSGTHDFYLEQGEKKFSLRYEISDLLELLDLTKESQNEICFEFRIYEKITFYREQRRVILKIYTENGTTVLSRDITLMPSIWNRASVYRLGFRYKQVLQAVRHWLEKEWEKDFPFQNDELTAQHLALLVRYPGFDRSFYDAIPFRNGSLELDPSFEDSASFLCSPKRAREALKTASLPQIHSVRKLFFEQHGLFFYLKECELLWQTLQDPNLLCRTLQIKHIFRILSDLHTSPGIFLFLRDFCHAKGRVILVNKMKKNWDLLSRLAFHYVLGNEHMRKEILTGKYQRVRSLLLQQEYSIPICADTNGIEDIRINGFQFHIIRTRSECRRVGWELHNCLSEIVEETMEISTLICIQSDGKTVGAIEVEQGEITQAYTAYNEPIGIVPGLQEATELWAKHFELVGMEKC